jgi:outer membrane protein OmpA-like peptidoglycan-associated protein
MKTFRNLLLAGVLLAAAPPPAQAQQLSDANELFDTYQIEEASKLYLRIVQKNLRGKEQATERLADCYRILGNKAEAVTYYAIAVDYPDASNRISFNYGVVLRDLGRYAEAKEQFVKYAAQAPGDLRGNLYASYMDQLVAWGREESGSQPGQLAAVNAADLNTEFVEVGAIGVGGQGVAFASARPADPKKKRRAAEKLKMWEAPIALAQGSLPTFGDAKLLLPVTRATSNMIQGPASFTDDGKTMFYTQSYVVDDGYGGQIEGLEIMYCTFDGAEWSKPESFPHNSREFNNAHPAISGDGKTLIYSSDISGGYGATDMYMSRLNGTRWEKPRNLGPNINTAEVEKYPTLVGDSVLYFSSNGHVTLGGQDILKSVYRNGAWTKAENMRTPVNSLEDDVCFVPLRGEQLALFSSARAGGKGDLDVYVLCPASLAEAKSEAAADTAPAPQPEAPAAATVAEAQKPEPVKEEPVKEEPVKEEPVKEEPQKAAPAPAPQPEVKKEEPKQEEAAAAPQPVPAPQPAPEVAPQPEPQPAPAPQPEVKKEEPEKAEAAPEPQPEPVKAEPVKAEPVKPEPAPQPAPAPQPEPEPAPQPAPQPEPAPRQLENKPEPATVAVKFSNIYFDKNSIYPSKRSYGTIGSLLVHLKNNPGTRVHFNVYSDAQGSEEVNLEVSQRRAKVLAAYMQRQGVAAGRITTAAYGDASSCRGCSEAERAKNRRAEVSLHEGQGRGAEQPTAAERRVAETPTPTQTQAASAAAGRKARQFLNIDYAKGSLYPDKSSYANIGNLIAFMKAHPGAIVELDVHSDAQGSESANRQTSDKRAKILSGYLQRNKVDASRIVLRSHGSSQPLNRCGAGVACSEREHALNRRAEVLVRY